MNTKQRLLSLIDCHNPSLGDLDCGNEDQALDRIVNHFRTRKGPHYLFTARDCETLKDEHILQEAQKVLDHHLFGHDFAGPIDWKFNPTVETSRDNEWSWSLFRTIYWQPLARAYALTKDERYVKEFCDQVRSFYEAWPAKEFIEWDEMDKKSPFPGHAWRTIEAGIRIYTTWLPCMEIFRTSEAFDAETWAIFLCSIHDHGTFLHKHYSNHERSSNWLSMEASALLQLGIMFPEFKDAQAWREQGYQRVMHEIVYCFDHDGAHMEHTPIYHLVASIAFMQAVQLCTINGMEVAPYAMPVLEKSAEFVMRLVKPDFSTPMIGDADRTSLLTRITDTSLYEGMNLSFFPDDLNELRAYFRWMAKLTGRSDFLYMATAGKRGNAPAMLDYQMHDAGIYCMRTGWTRGDSYWHVLGVRLERGEKSSHSHNDTGHLELMIGGEDILIDSGRYIYNSSCWKDWRHYFTGSLAHNTVYIDDHEMGSVPKVNRVRGVRTWCHAFEKTGHYALIDISHNGYVYMQDPVFHRRKVVFLNDSRSMVVIDHLTGTGKAAHDVRWTWNFAGTDVQLLSNHVAKFTTSQGTGYRKYCVAAQGHDQEDILSEDAATPWESRLYCGSEEPKGGWVSYGYPVREPIAQVQEVFSSAVPLTMATIIANDDVAVSMHIRGQHFRLQVAQQVICGDMTTLEVLQ
ncbi:MAG: hypothetical protein GX836_05775 [Spirochaetales bacterium]|nr:hypothetical protein [Spirochaetales bacterium]